MAIPRLIAGGGSRMILMMMMMVEEPTERVPMLHHMVWTQIGILILVLWITSQVNSTSLLLKKSTRAVIVYTRPMAMVWL
jgi:hypothetical protein